MNNDVVWLVEHVAREMDVACAVKVLLEHKHGVSVSIRNIYDRVDETLRFKEPKLVVWPFFYTRNALAVDDYLKAWPNAINFNLSWEELFYKSLLKAKAPSDDFARNSVIHHAWGDFFKEYLIANNVDKKNIFINGQPAYQLYRHPYSRYYNSREWLAQKYDISVNNRWIFFPENYRWAFGGKIDLFAKLGGDKSEMLEMQSFCRDSLQTVLDWCNTVAKKEGISVVFRTRPATNSRLIQGFFNENVGEKSPRLHFIKEESVREWILASDIVFSSFSTSLIESAVAGKPTFMAEPIDIPDSLYSNWYRHLFRVRTLDDFFSICLDNNDETLKNSSSSLKSWAESNLLANGDPIVNLAEFISQLIAQKQGQQEKRLSLSSWVGQFLPGKKLNFNLSTHEHDVFSTVDVEKRVALWKKILLP